MQSKQTSGSLRAAWLIGAILTAAVPASAQQEFSEWTQSTGFKQVEYRWRQNDAKGCDVEYRNRIEADRKKYKSRIVYQINGDEHEKPYTIVSFADPAPHLDQVTVCTKVTDVSVTRF